MENRTRDFANHEAGKQSVFIWKSTAASRRWSMRAPLS